MSNRGAEGKRYIRSYGADYSRDPRKDTSKPAWQLWEVVEGRAKRVGTARTPYQYLTFLFRGPVEERFLEIA